MTTPAVTMKKEPNTVREMISLALNKCAFTSKCKCPRLERCTQNTIVPELSAMATECGIYTQFCLKKKWTAGEFPTANKFPLAKYPIGIEYKEMRRTLRLSNSNKFRTTVLCNNCHNFAYPAKSPYTDTSLPVPVCRICWNRDINGSMNIAQNGSRALLDVDYRRRVRAPPRLKRSTRSTQSTRVAHPILNY